MEVADCAAPLVGEQEINIVAVILEEVFGEHRRAEGVAADVKILLYISGRQRGPVARQAGAPGPGIKD